MQGDEPGKKPLLIYDGDCGFCRRWIWRWKRVSGERVEYAAYQDVASQFPRIPRERFQASVQLVEPDGGVFEGAHAVFRALAHVRGRGWALKLYQHFPPFAAASEWFYKAVAGHRGIFSKLTRFF